jgi:hypothetical protein
MKDPLSCGVNLMRKRWKCLNKRYTNPVQALVAHKLVHKPQNRIRSSAAAAIRVAGINNVLKDRHDTK